MEQEVKEVHSRTKVGQNSLLLLEFVYANQEYKVYSLDRLIKIIPKEGKVSEQIRSIDDYEIDFSKLKEVANNSKIEKIRYYTETESIATKFKDIPKFEAMSL